MIYVIFARVYTLCSCKSEVFMSYMYALFRVKDKDCIVTKKVIYQTCVISITES